jgi:hypothetical protein
MYLTVTQKLHVCIFSQTLIPKLLLTAPLTFNNLSYRCVCGQLSLSMVLHAWTQPSENGKH